jgi:two-component system chemotaxis response regulator CheY
MECVRQANRELRKELSSPRFSCQKPTVLLLEQNQKSKKTMVAALEQAGYEVWEAVNGLRLISRLRVDRPDVVILDNDRAWTDCFDLCDSLKKTDRFGQVRVVLMADEKDSQRAHKVCCDRMVAGSLNTDDLLAALSEVLESS